jgi:hypothetical protein
VFGASNLGFIAEWLGLPRPDCIGARNDKKRAGTSPAPTDCHAALAITPPFLSLREALLSVVAGHDSAEAISVEGHESHDPKGSHYKNAGRGQAEPLRAGTMKQQ